MKRISSCFSLIATVFIAIMLIYGAPAHAQNNKQPLVQPAPPVIKPNDLKSIPDKYFKEADEFLKYCEAQTNMTLFYNCDCLSYEFLETRIRNPQMSQTSIVMEIDRTCLDASGAAGYEYERCLADAPLLAGNITPEEYCTCFSNTFAQAFEYYMPAVSSKSIVELQTQAYLICANPTVGRRMFPYDGPAPPKRR